MEPVKLIVLAVLLIVTCIAIYRGLLMDWLKKRPRRTAKKPI